MSKFQFAPGHNNADDLEDFAVQPTLTEHMDYGAVYTANGVAKKIGGGSMQVRWAYLERDEMIDLLNQFGVSHIAPSTQGTFLLPDWFGIHNVLNGQITIKTPDEGNGYFTNIVADITGLEYL
jgi:hypothetical protein